jgi:hypothetical protein
MMKNILIVLFVAFTFAACQPEPEGLKLYDELVVKTSVSPDVNFDEYQSYTIATDTIGFLTNVDPDDTIWVYSSDFQYPRKVINAVNSDLGGRFQKKSINDNPDLGVNVYVVSGLNIYQTVTMPSYYNNYYYGYYGSYYYPYVTTHVENRATLIIEIVDLKNRVSDGSVRVLWSAMMGDLITSVDYEQQSINAVKEAFEQSPYIFE